jgi:hypothetical protein
MCAHIYHYVLRVGRRVPLVVGEMNFTKRFCIQLTPTLGLGLLHTFQIRVSLSLLIVFLRHRCSHSMFHDNCVHRRGNTAAMESGQQQ